MAAYEEGLSVAQTTIGDPENESADLYDSMFLVQDDFEWGISDNGGALMCH